MKLILLVSFLFLNSNLILAQPINTPSIEIKNILLKNKPLCFTTSNGTDYSLSIKKKCELCKKSYNYDYALISVNRVSNFIYKKDTMQLKLMFDSHSPFRFQIDKLLFQKGNFNIDLKGCTEILNSDSFPIVIKKLPYDCKSYIEEDEEQ